MSIEMFNIAQTILGSVYASKEAAAKLNAPQIMQRQAAERARQEQFKHPKKITELEKAQTVHLDPNKDKERQGFGEQNNQQHSVDEYSMDEFPPGTPDEPGLGDHIDIMS